METKTLEEKGKEIAKTIKKSFLGNMEALASKKRHHFAARIYRSTGDSENNSYIISDFEDEKDRILANLANHADRSHVLKDAEQFFAELNTLGNRKGLERQKAFKSRKDMLFYLRMIKVAHIWNGMGFFKGEHAKNYSKWLNFLKSLDLKQIIFDDDIFKQFSTQLIVFVKFLKFNNVVNLEAEYDQKFNEVFGDDLSLDDLGFRNKVYTLTHYIIAESDYYQKIVSAGEYKWILDYFTSHIDAILEKTNTDIVAEVGLCFRLCGIDSGIVIDKVRERVVSEFDEEKGYIPRRDGSHHYSEHTNSVAFIFLNGFDRLHPGPVIE